MSAHVTAEGDDLTKALATALGDLFDHDVPLTIEVPDDVEVSNVHVSLKARVQPATGHRHTSADRTASATPSDANDDSSTAPDASSEGPEPAIPGLDEESEAAADFVEGLLDALDLPGHLKLRILDEEDEAEVEVIDVGNGALIGRRGQTLEAIQELLRSAMQREFQQRSRVKIDVEGYRARRLEKLLEKAAEAVASVQETGESYRLEPMDVFERKAVHRFVSAETGVHSRSQGREPGRRVVVEAE